MEQSLKSTPKDVFLHLLSIGTLYYVAVNFITLIWQYINIYFPDQLQPEYFSGYAGTIRFAMASLIIVYPVHCYVMRLLYRDYAAVPEKRELRVRKWLVHFTLFVTAIVIIGDSVTLVYNFLGGELTTRFLLKILTVFLTIGAIFVFYLRDLKNKWNEKSLRNFVAVIVIVMVIVVAGGFFTAGSPLRARVYRFDETRVNDLQVLQNELFNYWMNKRTLPNNLKEITSDIGGLSQLPADPESAAAYEYRSTGNTVFELCATFALPSPGVSTALMPTKPVPASAYNYYSDNWDHGAGRVCFSRTINPDRFPPSLKEVPVAAPLR